MSQVELQGTLREDGTLLLDERPGLPPGRVRVVLETVAASVPPAEDWWQYLRRARAELEARGYPFLDEQGVSAYLAELGADDAREERAYGGSEPAPGR